jgi:SAM-dependent methyltransferase
MASTTTERNAVHDAVFAAMAAKILFAAAELELPELLAAGPRTSAELADRTDAHAPSLRRLLRALAGLGAVEQPDTDRFQLTALGGSLRAQAPDSAHAVLTMLCGPENWRSWGELVAGVRSGEPPWELAHGVSWIEYYEQHPERAAGFNRAMAEHTRAAAPGILAEADLARFDTVMDVGGGDGTLLAEALSAHPQLTGLLFDLPVGLGSAAATLEAAGVAERCRLMPGDFFVSVPAGADACLLKQVLHDWDDEPAATILGNVRRSLAPDGRVLVVERMLPELVGEADVPALLLDLLMLTVTGGRERTLREFQDLFAAAGLELAAVTEPIPPFDYRVLEARARLTT